MPERGGICAVVDQRPLLKHNWDFRCGSPRKVFRAVRDALEDLQYHIEPVEPPELRQSPISDTAEFEVTVIGQNRRTFYRPINAVIGIILVLIGVGAFIGSLSFDKGNDNITAVVVGVISLVIGIIVLVKGSGVRWRVLKVKLEGEAYKAKAAPSDKAEFADMVADVRVTADGGISQNKSGTHIQAKVLDQDDWKVLEYDFTLLRRNIEAALPSFKLESPATQPE